jgi:hypothetical protein
MTHSARDIDQIGDGGIMKEGMKEKKHSHHELN